MKEKIILQLTKLFEVKSIVTISMTFALIGMLYSNNEVSKELLMLFSTSYGAIITYFFTKQKSEDKAV